MKYSRQAVFYGLLSMLLVVSLSVSYAHQGPKEVTIERTGKGFEPQKISIQKGDTVRFVNKTTLGTWPASNNHPTHQLYPEFDPRKPLAPKEEWTFTFNRVGMWGFHDHLAPEIQGTIEVVGVRGERERECRSAKATSSIKIGCWDEEISGALQSKGLDAAFELYASLYREQPEFRGLNCHDAGHILGAAAYKTYTNNHTVVDRLETAYCGYGFYHGFMEAMLVDQGPGHFDKVHEYCDALNTGTSPNKSLLACYHGIGHAAFDSLPADLWGDDKKMTSEALDVCQTALSGESERVQCGTGVFNALTNAYSAHSYYLSFPTDATRICRLQLKEYQNGCYADTGLAIIRNKKLDQVASVAFIESFSPEVADTLLYVYAADEIRRTPDVATLSMLHGFCTSLSSVQKQETCTHGVIQGILEGAGEPGKEYIYAFAFCGLYAPGSLEDFCYSSAIARTRSRATDASDFKTQCLALPVSIRNRCEPPAKK